MGETMKSIIQDNKECFISGRTDNLHSHHIFGGANRKLSEKYGLKIWLTAKLHNMSNRGVHFDKDLNELCHRAGQLAFERAHGTREEFLKIFGRNYL